MRLFRGGWDGGGVDSPASDFGKTCVSYKCSCWEIIFLAKKDAVQENTAAKKKICKTHKRVTRYVCPVGVDSCYLVVGISLIKTRFARKLGEGSWLRCWLWVLDGVVRSPVEWRFNGSSVPTWQTHEGSLALLNTTHSMEGNYSCHDEQGTLLQSIKLRLGRKSTSEIQESLVSCFDSQCESFDKIYEKKGLNNWLRATYIYAFRTSLNHFLCQSTFFQKRFWLNLTCTQPKTFLPNPNTVQQRLSLTA